MGNLLDYMVRRKYVRVEDLKILAEKAGITIEIVCEDTLGIFGFIIFGYQARVRYYTAVFPIKLRTDWCNKRSVKIYFEFDDETFASEHKQFSSSKGIPPTFQTFIHDLKCGLLPYPLNLNKIK